MDTRKDPISIISNWRRYLYCLTKFSLLVTIFSLSEEQVFLCQCRETLLEYLNRLNTYEVEELVAIVTIMALSR